ncbi:molecular chaperone [Pseudomonas chlororaphis]|jgi:P pilus assembly chaperone PapD|uniref:fimbrial biogenesis chaperone n=1 Tax=Pseudomonas chlororaphis TaxID=587753 RepID=UPI000F48A56C|nr:molecular chaperone [Pseudomonas chlororaphis]ROL89694.1 molecular chaperone [Pseudomonas chlororaphis]RON90928.1 molecular chaperone [Pseudomonas chlororaphis]
MKVSVFLKCILASSVLLCSGLASAGISLGGTRVVLTAPNKEASIMVKNEADKDIMIQSWVDAGDKAEKQDVPFAITPSLSRLGANKQQLLRLFYYGEGLPTDKESVFWLSVQEIPQKAEGENTLQIAVRQRIKVFYRPLNLQGSAEEAAEKLKWRLLDDSGKTSLEVTNDSLFHVSFGSASLLAGGKSYAASTQMIAPGQTLKFPVKTGGGTVSSTNAKVNFDHVNDYGSLTSHSSTLSN